MSFEDVNGQERAAGSLKTAIRKNRPAHAYIFAGPDGCGRSLLARNFAKALNCGYPSASPCGSCPSCVKIDNDTHPDVRWIRKDPDSREIKINQIREIEAGMILKPYEAAYKVFIIVEAERMNPAASNAFLKTLEEPPRDSVVVLITRKPQDLLPTIVSRSQVIRLRPADAYGVFRADSGVIDEFSDDGCIEDYSAKDREALSEKLKILAGWYRDLLVFKASRDESLLIHSDRLGSIREKAGSFRLDELMDMFDRVVAAKKNVDNNVNPKLALSAMFKDIG